MPAANDPIDGKDLAATRLPPLCKLFLYAWLESVSTKIYCQYMRFIDAGTTTRALVNMRRNPPRRKFHAVTLEISRTRRANAKAGRAICGVCATPVRQVLHLNSGVLAPHPFPRGRGLPTQRE